jgi:hypothetical protein
MKNGQRWIANNTVLYTAQTDRADTNEDCYKVKLHSTPIITFYKDGAVRIRTGGWANNPTTRDRLRSYMPGNMSVSWGGLRTITRPHFLCMRTDDGRNVVRPLGADRVFLPDGRGEDLALMNAHNADEVWESVLAYEKKFIKSFMRGEMTEPKGKIGYSAQHALKLLGTMELTVDLLSRIGNHHVFFSENYKRLSPTKPKLPDEETAEWMERHMKGDRMRPQRGSDRYRSIKNEVAYMVRNYFLSSLMFDDD